ncbi:hypothetical protein PYCC9005_003089 [Savitreella phatthalungensis]
MSAPSKTDEKVGGQDSPGIEETASANSSNEPPKQDSNVDERGNPIEPLNDAFSSEDINAIVSTVDDPDMPVNTFRSWFIGLTFTVLGTGINTFFSERLPGIYISSFVAQLLAYPAGKLLEKTLPTRRWQIGRSHTFTLNPGPFNAKEQMLITVFANVSFATAYASYVIIVQRNDYFYGQDWASSWVYMILLTLSSQVIGYGLAGLARDALVWNRKAVWPTALAVVALNRSFHARENPSANGWRVSKLRFFTYVFIASFVYFILGPGYLIQAMSMFNWMTWTAPTNVNLAAMTGGITGLGINPLPSFDWNMAAGLMDPIISPWGALVNVYAGMLFVGVLVIPALWYRNTWSSAYLPINSNKPFDNLGKRYDVRRILDARGRLDKTAYETYSPVYLSAANAILYGAYFAIYPAVIIHAALYQGRPIKEAFVGLFSWVPALRRRGLGMSAPAESHESEVRMEDRDDVHRKLMSVYEEVPHWWYGGVLVVGFFMAIAMIAAYPTDMPVWGLFFALGLGVVFLIPTGLIAAVSSIEIGLNVISELIVGFALPGRPVGMMIFKTYSTITLSQAVAFLSDLKLGHYTRIPPRTMFAAQVTGTVLSSIISVAVVDWQLRNVKDFCQPHQKQKFSCPSANTFFSASILFGVIGPRVQFGADGVYKVLTWGFLIGAFLPLPIYFAAKRWPNTRWISNLHVPLFLNGFVNFAPLNFAYITPALPIGYIFNVRIKRRAHAWWQNYAYVTSVAMSSSIAVASLLLFFALQAHDKTVDWQGNSRPYTGCDQDGCPLKSLGQNETFGVQIGSFKWS